MSHRGDLFSHGVRASHPVYRPAQSSIRQSAFFLSGYFGRAQNREGFQTDDHLASKKAVSRREVNLFEGMMTNPLTEKA